MVRSSFFKMKNHSKILELSLRMCIVHCYVLSVPLKHGQGYKNLEVSEIQIYCRMLIISWIVEVTDEGVLWWMNKDQELMKCRTCNKLEYVYHVMKNKKYKLLWLIFRGKIKRGKICQKENCYWPKTWETILDVTQLHCLNLLYPESG